MSPEVGLEVGVEVWIRCNDQVWRTGVVTRLEDGLTTAGTVVVESKGTNGFPEEVEVKLHPATPRSGPPLLLRNEELKTRQQAKDAHDLARLSVLNEAEVLHALQERFESGMVYTNTGPILLAVNPFRELPELYGPSRLREYVDLAADEENIVPHVFGVSRAAYKGVLKHALPQTVLVSGESGAGKTETTKFVMRYLALAGVGCAEESLSKIEHQVLDSIPLLEALGNAKTLRNHNSSRFGKYIEMHFASPQDSQEARVVGARMRTYLLEKVRVTSQQKGERSYHIFYQVLAAARRESVSQEGVGRGGDLKLADIELRGICGLQPQDFAYLRSSQCYTLGDGLHEDSRLEVMNPRKFVNYLWTASNSNSWQMEEAQSFDKVIEAMDSLGIDKKEVTEVLSAIVAVLHIGNIAFKTPAKNSEGSEVDAEEKSGALDTVCRLLGADPKEFSLACCTKTRKSPREGLIRSPVTVAKALESRDALARHLYGAVFAFIVGQVNTVLEVSGVLQKGLCALPFVGVLDIFGFEFFELNSFEQLCINYTNELLQQYFNEVIFEHEASLYTREGVQWDPLDFPNNSAIVNMIGKAPTGMLPMLDEECMTVGGNSQQWCDKLRKVHGSNEHFTVVRQRQASFVVRHFAGPVEYNSQEFVEKNRDVLSADLAQCMQASGNSFIQQRFLEHDRAYGTQESAVSASGAVRVTKARQYSVSSEFRKQLQELMERIRSTEPHFVRCLKPNPKCVSHEFNRKSVVEQLQYQGVLQAIEISRAGFPMRLRHRQAVLEFRCLGPPQTKIQVEAQIARGKLDVAARLLFRSLGDGAVPGLSEGSWAVGKTLVFLKKRGIEVISVALLRLRHRVATVIQAAWRCSRLRRKYARCRRSALSIQVAVRRFLDRRRFVRIRRRQAALTLQSAERGRRVRCEVRKLRKAALVIQAVQHARTLHKRFRWSLRLLRRFTCRIRLYLRRQVSRRRVRAAVLIQKAWRGYCGRRLAKSATADQHRLRLACRRLLARWRYKVTKRLLLRNGNLFDTLQDSHNGELYATSISLQDQLSRGECEARILKFEQDMLNQQVAEMNRWTMEGCFSQVVDAIVGTRALEDDPFLLQPTEQHDEAEPQTEFERWLIERRIQSPIRTPFFTPRSQATEVTTLALRNKPQMPPGYMDYFFCCANRQYQVP